MRLPASLLIFAAAASAQMVSNRPPVPMARAGNGGVVTGKPYSAQKVTEHVQVLADGTRLTQTREKLNLYRDSQGRTRTEQIRMEDPESLALIQISDPVAGVNITLDARNHTARRLPPPRVSTDSWPLGPPPAGANISPAIRRVDPAPARSIREEISRETLGTKTIEGVVASGVRITTVFPVGFFGNDRPFSTTTETWTSPELNAVVLVKTSDPRSGDTTTSLTNISLAEPDPSLFQIPPDYKIAGQ